MKKILASDLDGTLVEKNIITGNNEELVKLFQEQGNIFAVSTGRPLNGVEFLEEDYGVKPNYYILLNGALILDSNKKEIFYKTIEKDIVLKVLEKLKGENVNISFETGYCTYILEKGGQLPYPKQKIIENVKEVEGEISLISIYFPSSSIEEIERVKLEINSEFGEKVQGFRNSNYIDVVPLRCSKGEGVKRIANLEKVNFNQLYTIGDSWNDLSMFKESKTSFTFYNVEEGLKRHTTFLVESVGECIEEYILNK